jgi:mRNA interferase RelE/StbE
MSYSLHFSRQAAKDLSKLDKSARVRIEQWLAKHLNNCENPRIQGKPLTGNSGLWRYRVGAYRILCDIKDNELIIITVRISHRRDVYK